MRYVINFRWQRLKAVPKALFTLWVALFISLIFCAVKTSVFSPLRVESSECDLVAVIDASLFDSRDIKGSRFKLVIESYDRTFYLWYPVESFTKYKDAVEEDLLSGSDPQVSVSYLTNSSIQDIMSGHCRIVDLRSDDEVYYSMDDEILRYQSSKSTYLVLSFFLFLVLILMTFMIAVIYGVVFFRDKRKR